MDKSIIYYTDNRLDENIQKPCQKQLMKIGLPIVSVSLKPIRFGQNYVLRDKRGYLTMFKQILLGLEKSQSEVVFFCEHDVLYHPSHFEFEPKDKATYYYNHNNWKVRYPDGLALYYDCEQTLGLCGFRETLLEHYRKRVSRVTVEGYRKQMGFEPGKHKPPNGVDSNPWDYWVSPYPNIDIRHQHNLTTNRWSRDEFRSQKNCQNWVESEEVPGWGRTKGRFLELLCTI